MLNATRGVRPVTKGCHNFLQVTGSIEVIANCLDEPFCDSHQLHRFFSLDRVNPLIVILEASVEKLVQRLRRF